MLGTIVGKYRIVGQLGRGATGIVYRAVDQSLNREVAVKILNPALADSEVLKRFKAEATVLASLNHPEIATLYDLFRTGTELLMVMELVRGETLEHLCERLGPLPPERAAYLIDRILWALEHAHRAGVVHRDMKPSNVMVTELGHVKIMDFGVARVRGSEHVTVDGYVVGTPAYMPPEQALGKEVDGRADLYSVGVIFYRLVTGALPLTADTPVGMLQKQISDVPAPLRLHRDDLPAWCEQIVERALTKSPDDRFQSATEFRDALANATGIVTTSDLENGFAEDTRVVASPARGSRPTLVLSRSQAGLASDSDADRIPLAVATAGLVSAANGVLTALRSRHNVRAATILGVFTTSVAALASVPLHHPKTDRMPAAQIKTIPQIVFEAKILVADSRPPREREGLLVLTDRKLTITAAGAKSQPVHSVSFDDVVSISYSRGRDPMWSSPKGPAPVTSGQGVALRVYGTSAARNWITVRTNTASPFIVLRFDDGEIKEVLSALHERTGRTPQVIAKRKGSR